jgi:non-canonical poly(A) RNA polymerase PAPD5/7
MVRFTTLSLQDTKLIPYYRLHKEILAFYDNFKPRYYEDAIRAKLIKKFSNSLRKLFVDASVHPFGSFVAGLYLPTADMDLVLTSRDFMDGGYPKYDTVSTLKKLRNFLGREKIAINESIEMIAKAKVPLVKYVDKETGLRVDVSFENDTGLIANRTFQKWKVEFPAMPILVTLVKQFLAMRGLNEPVNGGIGGFSVTCLVTSLLQLMPEIRSGELIPEENLGEVLLKFFDFYGNEFDTLTSSIQLDPPSYISKVRFLAVSFLYSI